MWLYLVVGTETALNHSQNVEKELLQQVCTHKYMCVHTYIHTYMHVLLHIYVIIYMYPYINKWIVTNKYRKVQSFGGNNRELSLEGRFYEYIHMLILSWGDILCFMPTSKPMLQITSSSRAHTYICLYIHVLIQVHTYSYSCIHILIHVHVHW